MAKTIENIKKQKQTKAADSGYRENAANVLKQAFGEKVYNKDKVKRK